MRKHFTRVLESVLVLSVILILLPGYSQGTKEAVVIHGRVVSESSGKPIANAHVYVIDGEEETLTNGNGEFSVKSWQKAPLKLSVEKQDAYRKAIIDVADPSKRQVVRLKSK